jgi:hypothetical protein
VSTAGRTSASSRHGIRSSGSPAAAGFRFSEKLHRLRDSATQVRPAMLGSWKPANREPKRKSNGGASQGGWAYTEGTNSDKSRGVERLLGRLQWDANPNQLTTDYHGYHGFKPVAQQLWLHPCYLCNLWSKRIELGLGSEFPLDPTEICEPRF